MSLTEFLLARIAEDEATCEAVAHDSAGFEVWGDPPVWNGALTGTRRGHPHVVMDVSRARAECEAKRRIVERCQELVLRDARDPHRHVDEAYEYHDYVLPALALPYADHPDYREKWRPESEAAE